jgi:hypothetical protein
MTEHYLHRGWQWLFIAMILVMICGCAMPQGHSKSLLSPAGLLPEPPPSPALYLKSQVIRQDTSWSGQIIIEGVIVVGRRATLTIEPGTSVRFKRIDSDADGTGDSELRVLGGIVAEGTIDRPIIFASAEKKPARRDWSYLLIYSSDRLNRLSFCEFHHGFSGLQVHFSTASVNNCLFSDNNEGLRFGRADLTIVNNRFTNNDLGVRFTRMEGPALLQGNEITGNRIGIFLVPSGQNIRDFFEPDRSGQAWNTGRLKISGNNIYGNNSYNLSLGEKQFWNLEIAGNYWGSSDPEKIAATIFDRRRDESLGQVIFTPFATGKIAAAGIKK